MQKPSFLRALRSSRAKGRAEGIEAAKVKVRDAPGVFNAQQHNHRRMLLDELNTLDAAPEQEKTDGE